MAILQFFGFRGTEPWNKSPTNYIDFWAKVFWMTKSENIPQINFSKITVFTGEFTGVAQSIFKNKVNNFQLS